MRYCIHFCGVLFLVLFANFQSHAQRYHVWVNTPIQTCSNTGQCGGEFRFNGIMQGMHSGTYLSAYVVVETAQKPTRYSINVSSDCEPEGCHFSNNISGDMPSEYRGTTTLSTGGTLTYCWDPGQPAIQVTGGGSSYTLTMPVWGFSYQWEAIQGSGTAKPFKTDGNGSTVMQSSTVTVTPAMMAELFGGSGYGQNYYFRVRVTNCDTRASALVGGYTFIEPAPTAFVAGKTPATCYGTSTGTVTLTINNPAVNEFYINCTNTSTNESFPVPNAIPGSLNTAPVYNGNYTIRGLSQGEWDFQVVNRSATAANTYIRKERVTQPPPVTVSFSTPPHNGYAIRCAGGNGDVTAIGNGGVGDYKDFLWNTGATTATLSGVPANTYSVTLKDRNDCQSASTTVTLSAPTALSASITSPKPYGGYEVQCHDKANGSATASGAGGVPGSGYTYRWATGITNATAPGLSAGTHTVTVTDANGCTAPASVVLNAPVPVDFTIDPVQGLVCKGDRTAILEAKPVLSTIIGTAHYQWSGGERSAAVADKAAGTYSVTVTDDQGCSTTKTHTLTDPSGYTVSLALGALYNGSEIRCNGEDNGKLVSTVRDAANTVTTAEGYQWSKNGVVFADGPGLPSQDHLSKGTYELVITYGAQCKTDALYILDDPDPVSVTVAATSSYSGQAISCHNATDGNIRATASGGTGDHTYRWDNGATTQLLTGLGSGDYHVTVADANGCESENAITLHNPTAVEASIGSVSDYSGYGISCSGLTDGTMTASGSGGTGGYTYQWNNNNRTTAVNGALGRGTYTVTVYDRNLCSAQATEVITEPSVLTLAIGSFTDVACNGGSDGMIALAANGGVGKYQYSRDNGVTWKDEPAFTGLPIGAYTLLVNDGNGCPASTKQTLDQPSALTLAFKDRVPAFCADPRGGATADVSGGVTGYTYSWTDAQGNVVGTDMQLSGVRGGIYTLLVRDAHNCPISDKVGITSTDGAKADYTAIAARCHDSPDGSATLTITEGDEPFAIEWPDGQTSLNAINLKGGDYIVLITDGHDCTVIKEVTVPAPDALRLGVQSSIQPTCNGDCDGALTLIANGGVGTYTYAWNGQLGNTQSNLCKGTYAVVLTDGNGCKLEQPVTLHEPDKLTLKLQTAIPATCTDGCDGRLTVAGAGGNGGYVYSWDGGIPGATRSNLCPADYSVMVTDTRGCVGSGIITLPNTPPVPVDLGGGVTLCVGQTYTLNAGTGWRAIRWGGTGLSGSTQAVTIKDPGAYWLEVLDNNGCIGRDTFLLATSYDLLKASFMIPAEAVAGDTVAIVDISWPLPETVSWDFPLTMKRISGSDDVVFGQFNTTGTYAVGLTAHLGECVDYVEKNIVVIGGREGDTGGRLGYEAYVKAFGLYANPNDGSFDVVVDLAEEDDIILSVWNSQTGALIGKVMEKDNASYRIHVDLRPLSAGAYVLRLDHAKGSSSLRFIVR